MSSRKVILKGGAPVPAGQPNRYPDGVEVDANVALKSTYLKDIIEDFAGDVINIELPEHNNNTIASIFEYTSMKLDKPDEPSKDRKESLVPWQAEFFSRMKNGDDLGPLFNFILCVNYLGIKDVLDDACMYVASLIKGKTPEEIRKTFAVPPEVRA